MLWSMAQKVVSMEAKLLAVFSSGVPVKVTALCRELGISRQTLYKYRRRFEAEGPAGDAYRFPIDPHIVAGSHPADEKPALHRVSYKAQTARRTLLAGSQGKRRSGGGEHHFAPAEIALHRGVKPLSCMRFSAAAGPAYAS